MIETRLKVRPLGLPILVALAACATGMRVADADDTHKYRQTGSGAPVVVFESGLGNTFQTWHAVQREVGRFTETFSYNRAGYPGSPRAEGTRDVAAAVGELRALLTARGLSPPYVLVGHSLGGLYMLYYARNFPDEVAGLVLVDSTHWEQFERLRREAPETAAAAAQQARTLANAIRAEYAAIELSGREVRDSPPLRPMPFTVISAGLHPPPPPPPRTAGTHAGARSRVPEAPPAEFWDTLQRELAAQLPDSRHVVAERSDHVSGNAAALLT
jgi:pimeloyl-ACP methyl ester carboxylesterase